MFAPKRRRPPPLWKQSLPMWRRLQLFALRVAIMTRASRALRLVYWPSLFVSLFYCVWWLHHFPSAGVAIGALGAVGVLVAIKGELEVAHKVIWAVITLGLLITEVRAIHQEDRKYQDNFDGEMAQIMGGSNFPKFLAMPPINHRDDMWPILMMTPGNPWENGHTPTGAETAPLIDVAVDISEIPQPDFTNMTVNAEAFESQFLPHHYDLGTITVPEDRAAPFKLEAGKNYQLLIRTRRMVFVERIYFDRDEKAIGGWRTSECVSQKFTSYGQQTVTSGEKLIEGKCEN
jgi:hypothetical protein